jgi:hypothetical protein
MRTDHIEKVTSACDNLARLAQEVAAEHRRQIASLESIMRSTELAAGKWAGEDDPGNLIEGARESDDPFRVVIQAVEGEA